MSLIIQVVRCVFFLLLLVTNAVTQNTDTVPLKASGYGVVYGIEMQLGGQTLQVIVDTGSADLWLLTPGWKCYSGESIGSGSLIPDGECAFSKQTYHQTSTFNPISSATFAEHYGVGDAVGDVGYENVRIGSLSTLSQQEFALVDAATDPIPDYREASGVLGLAYPVLGQIHPSNFSPTTPQSYLTDRIKYPTVLTRLLDMGATYFGLALQRIPLNQVAGSGGYMSFGTLPPVAHGGFVTVPVEIVDGLPLYFTNGTKQISYWTTTVEALQWNGTINTQRFQVVVDSGNWVNYVPADLAEKVNAAFDPPGNFNSGFYVINCTASPPADFGIKIGGTMFNISSADMIWRDVNGTCFSTVSKSLSDFGLDIAILGGPFLKNVVAVFDYGQHEMRFAPRLSESTTAGSTQTSGGTSATLEVYFSTFVLAVTTVIATLM